MDLKVFETPGEEWDDFASRYTDLIFYRSVWSDVLKKGLGGQPLYFYLKEGNEIAAGFPGVLLNFKLFKIFYASIPYGNLIGRKPAFPVLMEHVEREFQRRGIDQVRITESPFSESHRPDGYRTSFAKVSLLDLRHADREKVWKGYKKYIRRDVRKAEEAGSRSIQGIRLRTSDSFMLSIWPPWNGTGRLQNTHSSGSKPFVKVIRENRWQRSGWQS